MKEEMILVWSFFGVIVIMIAIVIGQGLYLDHFKKEAIHMGKAEHCPVTGEWRWKINKGDK